MHDARNRTATRHDSTARGDWRLGHGRQPSPSVERDEMKKAKKVKRDPYPRPSYREAVDFIAKHDPQIKEKDWLNIDLQAGTLLVELVAKLFRRDPLEISASIVRHRQKGGFV